MRRISRRTLLSTAATAAAIATTRCSEPRQAEAPSVPVPSKSEQLAGKLVEDLGAGARAALSYIGDRLGLFKAMAGAGPLTVDDLTRKTRLHPRYVRAWLETMVAAEYIEYQPEGKRFLLPPEHAPVLADEESPLFMGGALEFLLPAVMVTPKVQDAFRTGKGVAYSDYMPEIFEAIARWSAPGFKHQLVQTWIPAMPQVHERLRAGGTAADVGCGQGVASLVMARAFPQSRFWGFDQHAPSIERARANAQAEGLTDRVTFEVVDGVDLPTRGFDLISSFDVLHDSANPLAIVRGVRTALAPEGTYLAVEPNLAPNLEKNINAFGRMVYPVTTLYCMSVSLGQGGAGIGSDINEGMVQEWGRVAGFSRFRKLPIEDPLAFFEMRI
jgi:SAM-dependent methyltransferase